jgi:hypothetical protein
MATVTIKAAGIETLKTLVGTVEELHGVYPEDPATFRVKAFHPLASLVVHADYMQDKGGWNFTVEEDGDLNAPHPDWPVRLVESPEGRTAAVIIEAPDGVVVSREE